MKDERLRDEDGYVDFDAERYQEELKRYREEQAAITRAVVDRMAKLIDAIPPSEPYQISDKDRRVIDTVRAMAENCVHLLRDADFAQAVVRLQQNLAGAKRSEACIIITFSLVAFILEDALQSPERCREITDELHALAALFSEDRK